MRYDALRGSLSRHFFVVEMIRQERFHVYSCIRARNFKQIGGVTIYCVYQRRLPLRINRSHSPDVTGEVTFADEIGQYRLVDDWIAPSQSSTRPYKGVHQIGRNNHVAYAQ